MELAKRVGARAVLVTTGAVTPQQAEGLGDTGVVPDHVASSLAEAVEWIRGDAQARFCGEVVRRAEEDHASDAQPVSGSPTAVTQKHG